MPFFIQGLKCENCNKRGHKTSLCTHKNSNKDSDNEGNSNDRKTAEKQQKLKIAHINTRSLLSCIDEVKLIILNSKIDILCISETWLEQNIPDRFVNIDGYTLFRKDGGRGGGTCMYVKNCLKGVEMKFNHPACQGIEDVWVKIQMKKLPSIIVGAMYRHPHATSDSFDYIHEIIQRIAIDDKAIFLLGDLNDNVLDRQSKLQKIVNILNFSQLIETPTRITNTSRTLIDVAITNSKEKVLNAEVEACHVSDHELISLTVDISKPKHEKEIKTFRSKQNYSQEIFCNTLLDNIDRFNEILRTDDVNIQQDIFTTNFMSSLDSCAPIVTKTITRPPAPWLTDDIRNEMAYRNRLKERLHFEYNEITEALYKLSKKRVKRMIRIAKSNFHRNRFINERNSKKNIWNIVNEVIPCKSKCSSSIIVNDPVASSERFNEFFANVGKKTYESVRSSTGHGHLPQINQQRNNMRQNLRHRFRPQPVSVDTVVNIVMDMKNKNSSGMDGISIRFLKDSLPVLAFYLTVIINTSIVTGVVPDKWKHAIVCPLLKQGDVEDPSNYRPISLLSVLSKILEKVVAKQLYEFLSVNNLFSECQHGFRKGLSTQTALIKITEELYKNIDKFEVSLLALCDLSKAFDSVSHSLLLQKMDALQVDDFWFSNYLSNRTQAVKINSAISSKQKIEYGVPQGSVLGPLLFNIFINDLNEVSGDSTLVQFADDAQFLLSAKVENLESLVQRMEATMERVNKYFSDNGLKVNSDKTQFIFIGSRAFIDRIPEDIKIKVGNTELSPKDSAKNLGVILDSHLSFEKHVDYVCTKANGLLFFLMRNKDMFDNETRKIVVEALVISLFTYCSLIWGACTTSIRNKLQKVQNFAAKVSVGYGRKHDHATPFIKKLDWLKINEMLQYHELLFMFKIVNSQSPVGVLSITQVGQTHERITRQIHELHVPRTRTLIADKALSIRGSTQWNKLPDIVKQDSRMTSFKNKIKEYVSR